MVRTWKVCREKTRWKTCRRKYRTNSRESEVGMWTIAFRRADQLIFRATVSYHSARSYTSEICARQNDISESTFSRKPGSLQNEEYLLASAIALRWLRGTTPAKRCIIDLVQSPRSSPPLLFLLYLLLLPALSTHRHYPPVHRDSWRRITPPGPIGWTSEIVESIDLFDTSIRGIDSHDKGGLASRTSASFLSYSVLRQWRDNRNKKTSTLSFWCKGFFFCHHITVTVRSNGSGNRPDFYTRSIHLLNVHAIKVLVSTAPSFVRFPHLAHEKNSSSFVLKSKTFMKKMRQIEIYINYE